MNKPVARWANIGALVVLGLFAAFWTFMGVGEMAGGDPSGVMHLFPVVVVLALMWAAQKWPWVAGGVLVFFGALTTFQFLNAAVLMGGPLLLSGLLILAAAWAGHSPAPGAAAK